MPSWRSDAAARLELYPWSQKMIMRRFAAVGINNVVPLIGLGESTLARCRAEVSDHRLDGPSRIDAVEKLLPDSAGSRVCALVLPLDLFRVSARLTAGGASTATRPPRTRAVPSRAPGEM